MNRKMKKSGTSDRVDIKANIIPLLVVGEVSVKALIATDTVKRFTWFMLSVGLRKLSRFQ